jgi:DNA repair exonuclease SbcCD ATPase subunit
MEPNEHPGYNRREEITFELHVENKALRAELAEANARIAELEEECDAYQMQRDAANARAEAAERRVGELSEALSQFDPDGEGPSNGALDEAMVAGLGASRFNAEVRAERAEAESAALRAQLTQAESDRAALVEQAAYYKREAEARLAAAREYFVTYVTGQLRRGFAEQIIERFDAKCAARGEK